MGAGRNIILYGKQVEAVARERLLYLRGMKGHGSGGKRMQ